MGLNRKMTETEILKHSVGCYFCGDLVDERECTPADDYNGEDGGSMCERCQRLFENPRERHILKLARLCLDLIPQWHLEDEMDFMETEKFNELANHIKSKYKYVFGVSTFKKNDDSVGFWIEKVKPDKKNVDKN